jgi:hypothetical protein
MFGSTTVRLRHHVRVVHASTGAPIRGLAVPSGQHARVVPDGVVVAARADAVLPDRLAITVTDGVLADLLVFPSGAPPRTVLVDLVAEEIEVALHPVPMTLTVDLVVPSTGAPSTGRAVTTSAGVDLPEVEPGTYRSSPVEWTAALTPAELLVDGNPLRTVHMDLRRTTTRVRLVDTN